MSKLAGWDLHSALLFSKVQKEARKILVDALAFKVSSTEQRAFDLLQLGRQDASMFWHLSLGTSVGLLKVTSSTRGVTPSIENFNKNYIEFLYFQTKSYFGVKVGHLQGDLFVLRVLFSEIWSHSHTKFLKSELCTH